MTVNNSTELNALVARVKKAQREYANYTQEQVDRIFRAAALAAANARIPLAKMAVEESGMGIVEDKVIKNHFASEYIYNKYKDEKPAASLRRRYVRHHHHCRTNWDHLWHCTHHKPNLYSYFQSAD